MNCFPTNVDKSDLIGTTSNVKNNVSIKNYFLFLIFKEPQLYIEGKKSKFGIGSLNYSLRIIY